MAESFEIAEGHVTIKTKVDGKDLDVVSGEAGKTFVRRMQKSADDETKKTSKGFMTNLVKKLFSRDPDLWRTLQHPIESIFARPFAAIVGAALIGPLTGAIAAAISSAALLGLGGGALAAGTAILVLNEKLQKKFAKERLTKVRADSSLELRIMRANLHERLLALQRAGASEEVIRHARLVGESEISKKVLETNAEIKAASAATTTTVTDMFKKAATSIGGSLTKAALPLVGPIQRALTTMSKWVGKMEPQFEKLFAAAAPIIPILTDTFTKMAEAILPTIIKIMPSVVKMFEILAARSPEIADAINQLLIAFADPSTLEAFSLLLTGFITTIKLLGPLLVWFTKGFINDMRDIETAVHFIRDLPARFERAWNRVIEVVRVRAGLVRDWWDRTWGGIAKSVDTTWDKIVGAIDRWWDKVVERARALPGKVSDALKELPGRLLDNFAYALGYVSGKLFDVASGVLDWWQKLPVVIGARFVRAWDRTTETVDRRSDQLLQFFQELPGRVGAKLVTLGPELGRRFNRAWDATYETLVRRGGQAIDWVQALPGRIGSALSSLAKELGGRFDRAWDATYETIVRRSREVGKFFGGLPKKFSDAMVALSDRFIERFSAGWAAATGTSQKKVKDLLIWVRGIPQRISDAMNQLAAKLGARAISGWTNFQTGASTIWTTKVKPWVQALPGNIVKGLGSIGTKLVESGRQLLQGLLVGVRKRVDEVGGLGKFFRTYVVDPIVRAVKNYFGIKSPSTVFAGIGANLVAGLWKGVSSTNPRQMIGKIFGGMDDALLALVTKGLVNLRNIPAKVLRSLGGLFDDLMGGGGGSASGLVGFAKLAWNVLANAFHLPMGGWRARGSVPGSDHPKGKAIDIMTKNPLLHKLIIELGKRLPGAKYWISMRRIALQREGWRSKPYHGPNPHTDHVHWSFFHRGGELPEDVIGVGPSGRRYKLLKGETIIQRQSNDTVNNQGVTIHGGVHLHVDPRTIKDFDDVVHLVKSIPSAARQVGVRPRARLGVATS